MPTASPQPPVMPDISVPIIDPKSGQLTLPWFKWLVAWENIWRTIRSEIP